MSLKLLDFIASCLLFALVGVSILILGPWIVTGGVTIGQFLTIVVPIVLVFYAAVRLHQEANKHDR